ncbi:uncharacterized protein LOC132547652 [Ylistrum balloti]|uniref:uncharacterized protein LOC132547652 n=1 Tax=Ylistrum balloti TaxID=509963 RepID=UPI002905E21C|nr:uncharacterized protein LOC132547652 [Ylistrum balloti]
MAAGESSSDRMVDEEHQNVQTKTRLGCVKPRTLGLFFVVSILINFLLVSIMLGLLLAGKLAHDTGTDHEKGEDMTADKSAVKSAALDIPELDQVCLQCDPGDGVKLELVTLYPINNGTKPLCCKTYSQTEKDRKQQMVQTHLGFDILACPPIPDQRVKPAGLCFLDFERSSDRGLRV